MTENATLWGLWGGRQPGAWCSFLSAHRTADRLGYSYVGTREEAEAGRTVFLAEGHAACTYEVVPFDVDRLPTSDEVSVLTKPQADFLRALARGCDYNQIAMIALGRKVTSATTGPLHARGWIFDYVPDPSNPRAGGHGRFRVTPAGLRALERYDAVTRAREGTGG